MAMREFPEIILEGPTFRQKLLWKAELRLGFPRKAGASEGAEVRNDSLRALVVREEAINTGLEGTRVKRTPYQAPLLLTAAVTPRIFQYSGDTEVWILSKSFKPSAPHNDSVYADVRFAPAQPWPIRQQFPQPGENHPSAPPQRATQGRVRVCMSEKDTPADLVKALSLDWNGGAKEAWILGGLRIEKQKDEANRDAIQLDLVPEGIEIDVLVPDPFDTESAIDRKKVRVRVVVATVGDGKGGTVQELRLQLVGGESEVLQYFARSLAELARDLAQRDGAVSLQIADGAVPPLYWPVVEKKKGIYFCCEPEEIPEMRINERSSAVRILTRQGFEGEELAVAHLHAPRISLLNRRTTAEARHMVIISRIDSVLPGQAGPEIRLSWSDAGNDTSPRNRRPDEIIVRKFDGVAETEALRARLTDVWRRSGTLAADANAPYAFIALERGWVQLPLPSPPPRTSQQSPPPPNWPSTFDGFLRLDLRSDSVEDQVAVEAALPGLSLLGAHAVQIEVHWAADGKRRMDIAILGSQGILEGVLWAGEASPSGVEILPSLDAGPAALRSIDVGFGRPGRIGWDVKFPEIIKAQFATVTLALPEAPAVMWAPAHPTLALVSAAAMTRTAENALRPSTTRELIPFELRGAKQRLELVFAQHARLPIAQPRATPATVHGAVWRWQWPALYATGEAESAASPLEDAGVSLACLTVPGIELTMAQDSTLRFSLRYDLPLLDELFANVTAPKPKTPSLDNSGKKAEEPMLVPAQAERPTTSLEPDRLSVKWRENARRLARARTQADRVVVLHEKNLVLLWHPLSGADSKCLVYGLVEPYLWEPGNFKFVPSLGQMGVDLGAYALGQHEYFGQAALGGFCGSFEIDGDRLKLVERRADIEVKGFAASSFEVPGSGGQAELQDARGLSLAREPGVLARDSERLATFRLSSGPVRRRLVTLMEPCAVGGKPLGWRLWFRDLPLNDSFAFDRSAGLETDGGSGAEATIQLQIAAALYEWRLYRHIEPTWEAAAKPKSEDEPGHYEIPIGGPFSLRPLRLEHLRTTTEGVVTELNVIASVQVVAPEGTKDPASPFAADNEYRSGNLVRLTFTGADLSLESITRVEFHPTAKEDLRKAESPRFAAAADTTVTFAGDALAGDASHSESVRFGLALNLAVKNGAVVINAARLQVALFGQRCVLSANSCELNETSLGLTFEGTATGFALKLQRLYFSWHEHADSPHLEFLIGAVELMLHAGAQAPRAFVRRFGSAVGLEWLGVQLPPQRERMDHDLGAMTIEIDAKVPGDALLFRGFSLPTGRVRGTIAIVLAGKADARWPNAEVQTCFAEIAFTTDSMASPQRVTAIRHRHIWAGPVAQWQGAWQSRLFIDACFSDESISSIHWPVGCASLDPHNPNLDPVPSLPFSANPDQSEGWVRTLAMKPGQLILQHRVQPRFCAHRLPVEHIVMEGAEIVLATPWRVRAAVDHGLRPADGQTWPGAADGKTSIEWTTVEEVTLFDLKRLSQFVAQTEKRFTFLARRRNGNNDPDVILEGVARTPFANVGFPVRILANLLNNVGDLKPMLLLTGASVTEMTIPTDIVEGLTNTALKMRERLGLTVTPHWILPWVNVEKGSNPFERIPQVAATAQTVQYRIAAYDAAAGALTVLSSDAPRPVGVQDGTQILVERRLEELRCTSKSWLIADQSFSVPEKNAPTDAREQPVFPRTMLGLRTFAVAFGRELSKKVPDPQAFAQGVTCVLTREPLIRDEKEIESASEIRIVVNSWPRDAEPLELAHPGVTLVVLDREGIKTERLPSGLATALADPWSDELQVNGPRRADATMRALGLSKSPRIVLLARVDDSYLTIRTPGAASGVEPEIQGGDRHDQRTTVGDALAPPPHVSWTVAGIAKALLTEKRAVDLRKRTDTLHASPTLGWPEAPNSMLATFQPKLGDERVLRSEQHAWAGRERSVSWPAKGLPLASSQTAAFISMGQRVAFRWQMRMDLRSPADRFAVLTPPRARMPLSEEIIKALEPLRPKEYRAELAPLLAGTVQTIVTGQRPGVRVTQHEGLLWSESGKQFDTQLVRFGRPASRGPVIVRQVRAPRSSGFQETDRLLLRRRTFVAEDETEGARLKPFKLVEGPSIVAREERDDKVRSVTLTIASPEYGRIAVDWNGSIVLIASSGSGDPAHRQLGRVGVLPPKDPPIKPLNGNIRGELQVGDAVAHFDMLTWAQDADQKRLRLTFQFAQPEAANIARQAVTAALQSSSANTPIRFTIHCLPDHDHPVASSNTQGYPLGSTTEAEQLFGPPPRVLTFSLPHLPAGDRWLPIPTYSLAFGDPAYDRELGSPARLSQAIQMNDVPHLIGADRVEYNVSATIHFAVWKLVPDADQMTIPVGPGDPQAPWSLQVKVIPLDGSAERLLKIENTKQVDGQHLIDTSPGRNAYAISLPSLLETTLYENAKVLPRADLKPGDRIALTVTPPQAYAAEKSLSVDIGIVAEPVLPPPAAVFGLATLRASPAVGCSLYATAPLPQTVDFPHLIEDLMAGHVRRRGLFLWPFGATVAPANRTDPFAYLVKLDRTGGGQLPSSKDDFAALEK